MPLGCVDSVNEEIFVSETQADELTFTIIVILVCIEIIDVDDAWLDLSGNRDLEILVIRSIEVKLLIIVFATNEIKSA